MAFKANDQGMITDLQSKYANDVFQTKGGNTSNLAQHLKRLESRSVQIIQWEFEFILTTSKILSFLCYPEMHMTILFETAGIGVKSNQLCSIG